METAEKEILSIDITPVEDEQYIAPVQSANTLFHFFTEPDFLYSMLKRSLATIVEFLFLGAPCGRLFSIQSSLQSKSITNQTK